MCPKFAGQTSELEPRAHVWPAVYQRERLNQERLVAAVAGSGIDLILELLKITEGPFGILYVLLVALRTRAGRYQLTERLDRDGVTSYLERFRTYLEGDGRHDLWIKCGDSLIVYDRHERLFLYGDVDGFCSVLESLGYSSGEVRLDFAHEHHYNSEFDDDEVLILEAGDYTRFDLVPGQDFREGDRRYQPS